MNINDKIADRISIQFDINVWNFLARDVSDEATRIKTLLKNLVERGKVFCPLSFSVIAELLKQNYESALRTGSLMEELSLNISFALDKEIYNKEILAFLQKFIDGKKVSVSKSDIYVPIMQFVGADLTDFMLSMLHTASKNKLEEYRSVIDARIATMTLTDILNAFKPLLPLSLYKVLKAPEYSEIWKERWAYAKGNKLKMREIEQNAYVMQILIPELLKEKDNLPNEARQKFMDYIKSLSKNSPAIASREIISNLPALRSAIEILTITGYDPTRKGTMNDFFDIQIMVTPLAYADVLVATDKWIKHLITTQSDVFDVNRAVYFHSLSDFEIYLKSL